MLIIVQACACICVCVCTCVNSGDFVLSMCMRSGMYVYVCVSPGRIRFGFRGEKGKRRMEEFSYEAHK